MTTLTIKQFEKLKSIENSAFFYVNIKLKKWNPESVVLANYRRTWRQLAEKYNIMSNNGEDVYFLVENGESYAHGYNFSDVLA